MLNQTMVHHILHLAFYFILQLGRVPVWPDEHRLGVGTKGISWPEKEVAMLVLRISPETLATIAEQEQELESVYYL